MYYGFIQLFQAMRRTKITQRLSLLTPSKSLGAKTIPYVYYETQRPILFSNHW